MAKLPLKKLISSETKVLMIGDQHFKHNNIPTVEIFLTNLQSYLEQESKLKPFSFIVSGGDLLDTHETLHTQPLNYACRYIKLLASFAPTFVLVGNHDQINCMQFLNTNHWLNCFKEWDNVTVVDTVVQHIENDHLFTFAPFVPDGRLVEALDTVEDWKNSNCVFAHQTLDKVKMGIIVVENVEDWKTDYPLIISGHIHEAQTIGSNIIYVGSAFAHAFGDSDTKFLSVFTWTGNGDNTVLSIAKIDLELPKKLIKYMSIDEIKASDDTLIPSENNSLRITVEGGSQSFQTFRKSNKYKELTKKGIKIVFKPSKEMRENNAILADGELAGREFFDIVKVLISKEATILPAVQQIYDMIVK